MDNLRGSEKERAPEEIQEVTKYGADLVKPLFLVFIEPNPDIFSNIQFSERGSTHSVPRCMTVRSHFSPKRV